MTNNITLEKSRINLNELLIEGLATTQEQVESILDQATRGNDFYIGTDVKKWLSNFTAITLDDMLEDFSQLDDENEIIENSHLEFNFTEISHDNSYNWGGQSNCDIDFKILQGENEKVYMFVRIHVGMDIRAGYTNGILLDLETYNTDCYYLIFDSLSEFGNSAYMEIDGIGYSIDSDIITEGLRIYNHENFNDIQVYDSIYEFDIEGFNNALKELILENIDSL